MEELCPGSWWDVALEIPDGVPALENWWEGRDALDVITISSKPFTPLVIERSVWKLGACKLTERVSQGCLTSVTCAHPLCYHAWRCCHQWIPSPRHNKAKSPPMRTALPGWNVRRLDKSILHITPPQARRGASTGVDIQSKLSCCLPLMMDRGLKYHAATIEHVFCTHSVTVLLLENIIYTSSFIVFQEGEGGLVFLWKEKKNINFSCKIALQRF